MEKKYNFIYKTTNLINYKFYIGMHSTNNMNDTYIGSGTFLKRSIKKYGVENFKFEILEFVETREELKKREKELINEELLKDPFCMNIKLGGEGGFDHIIHDKKRDLEHLKKARERSNWLRKNDENWKQKTKEINAKNAKKASSKSSVCPLLEYNKNNGNPMKGKKHTNETKKKMSLSHENKNITRENQKEINQKIANSLKGKYSKEKSSSWGKCHIHSLEENISKQVLKEELQLWLDKGWKKGILPRNKIKI